MNEKKERLEYLRGELRAERISYQELCELEVLAPYIDSGDVELLEAAGIPEGDCNSPSSTQNGKEQKSYTLIVNEDEREAIVVGLLYLYVQAYENGKRQMFLATEVAEELGRTIAALDPPIEVQFYE